MFLKIKQWTSTLSSCCMKFYTLLIHVCAGLFSHWWCHSAEIFTNGFSLSLSAMLHWSPSPSRASAAKDHWNPASVLKKSYNNIKFQAPGDRTVISGCCRGSVMIQKPQTHCCTSPVSYWSQGLLVKKVYEWKKIKCKK